MIRNPIIWLLAIFGIACLLISTGYVYADDNLEKLQKQVLANTVQLNGSCSGTVISSKKDKLTGEVETRILTAKHCVENRDKRDMIIDVPVYQKNRVVKKEQYIARVKGKYHAADLAIIVLKDHETIFPSVSKIAPVDVLPRMGEQVWTVGYPLGLQLTVTPGLFGSLETLNYPSDGVEYFRASPDVVGGNSGGAMYHRNDAGDYELIGVTTAAHQLYTFVAFYTPIEVIHEYLKVAAPDVVSAKPIVKVGGN